MWSSFILSCKANRRSAGAQSFEGNIITTKPFAKG